MARKTRQADKHAVICVGDGHCACQYGLFPTDLKVRLDGGGYYRPSASQGVVWHWWREFCNDFVPGLAGNRKRTLILGGDWLEGSHHRVTSPITHNMTDQRRIAVAALAPALKGVQAVYALRGTKAHSGESGSEEEELAEKIGAIPDRTVRISPEDKGAFARWSLNLRVGRWLLNATHPMSVSSRALGEVGALARHLADCYVAAARGGEAPPDILIRFHSHFACTVQVSSVNGMGTALSVAGWQLLTPFTHTKRDPSCTPPQIGGAVILLDDDAYSVHHFVRTIGGPSQVTA